MHWLAVFVGGGLGALARFAVARAFLTQAGEGFPWGTLAVNWIGCIAIGLVSAWLSLEHTPPALRAFVITGLLGGFTTFSAFGLETMDLLTRGAWVPAALYVFASVAGGLAGVGAGLAFGREVAG